MKTCFIWERFLDSATNSFLVGGVQTYILHLCRLSLEQGWEPIVIQCADRDFEVIYENIRVIGVDTKNARSRKKRRLLYNKAQEIIDLKIDFLIFAYDIWSLPNSNDHIISIQHGIFWDLPLSYQKVLPTRFTNSFEKAFLNKEPGAWLKRFVLTKRAIKCYDNCKNRVCVDYNFINWYRAVSPRSDTGNTWVIPNFAESNADKLIANRNEGKKNIRILYARRFTKYRGTQLIADVVKSILKKYSNVSFTFAGEGPDEKDLKSIFSNESRVQFIKYLPDESLSVHSNHDMAIVPSIGSEGTCLSLAEAMMVGCVPVVTNVGGITNMILDSYNGIMVMPDRTALVNAIAMVIEDSELRKRISQKAKETALEVFSYERWKSQWLEVFSHLINKH